MQQVRLPESSNVACVGLEFDEMLAPAILIQTRDQVDLGQIQSADQAAYEGVRSWFMGYR